MKPFCTEEPNNSKTTIMTYTALYMLALLVVYIVKQQLQAART